MELIEIIGATFEVIVLPVVIGIMGYMEKRRIERAKESKIAEQERKETDIEIRKQLTENMEEQKRQRAFLLAQQEGTMALIRESIVGIHKQSVNRGSMDMHQRESLNKLYTAYKGMNGNGMVDTLYAEMSDPDIVTTRVTS